MKRCLTMLKKKKVKVLVSWSCLTLCDPRDCNPPGYSVLEFSWQEYWSGLIFPPPGHLSNPGIKLVSPAAPVLAGGFFTTEPPGKHNLYLCGTLVKFNNLHSRFHTVCTVQSIRNELRKIFQERSWKWWTRHLVTSLTCLSPTGHITLVTGSHWPHLPNVSGSHPPFPLSVPSCLSPKASNGSFVSCEIPTYTLQSVTS